MNELRVSHLVALIPGTHTYASETPVLSKTKTSSIFQEAVNEIYDVVPPMYRVPCS